MARLGRGAAPAGGVLRLAERTGLRKGMSGSKGWFYVGTGLWTLRTVRRLAERKTEILVSERLAPGERIVIANGKATIEQAQEQGSPARSPQGERPTRRKVRKADRKQADKAAKAAAKASAKAAKS